MHMQKAMWGLAGLLLLIAAGSGYYLGITSLCVRVVCVAFMVNALVARRCVWVMSGELRDPDQAASFQSAVMGAVMVCAVQLVCTILQDISTLVIAFSAQPLMKGCGLSVEFINEGIALLFVTLIVEIAWIVLLLYTMYDVHFATVLLSTCRLDRNAIEADLKTMGVARCCVGGTANLFSGEARTIGGRTTVSSTSTMSTAATATVVAVGQTTSRSREAVVYNPLSTVEDEPPLERPSTLVPPAAVLPCTTTSRSRSPSHNGSSADEDEGQLHQAIELSMRGNDENDPNNQNDPTSAFDV